MSEPDPGTLYVQDGVLYGNPETQKAWKEALKGSSRISAILHIIMNNSINQGLRICHWIPAQSQ